MAVPPGSRRAITSCPLARRRSTSSNACVDLPAPSGPSRVMNTPRSDDALLVVAPRSSAMRSPLPPVTHSLLSYTHPACAPPSVPILWIASISRAQHFPALPTCRAHHCFGRVTSALSNIRLGSLTESHPRRVSPHIAYLYLQEQHPARQPQKAPFRSLPTCPLINLLLNLLSIFESSCRRFLSSFDQDFYLRFLRPHS